MERLRNNKRTVPVDDLRTFALENDERARKDLDLLPVPSKRTFEREIEKLNQFHVVAARDGENAARRKFRIGGRREGALTAGEKILIDCWRVQLKSLKLPGQFWVGLAEEEINQLKRLRFAVCAAMCEASKVVVGIRICLNPDEETAIETLEMICRDKTNIAHEADCISTWSQAITPGEVGVDNGSEFIGARFQDALIGIGAQYEAGPARQPDARPGIERFFRTADNQLMPLFQGRTFGNVAAKGDYDSDAKANVTIDTLSRALIRWIVDVYHNTPHEGLGGETPKNAWDRLVSTYGVLPPPSAETMRAVFGVSTTRRIQNRGIRVMGLFYRRSEDNRLGKLRIKIGQGDVRIKIDRQNLGSILVRENVNGAEWFQVACDLDEMAGVDALSWIETYRSIRRRNLDQSKLSEAVVLGALRDIRRLGLESARAAGLGPSTMTRESLLEIEEREFRDVNIVA
ncbi:transposase, partial [Xanthobacter sp. V0B-10]